MNRLLILTCAALLLGCPKNPSANSPDGNVPEHSATPVQAGEETAPTAPAAPAPSTDASTPRVPTGPTQAEGVQTDPAPTNGAPAPGGRMAKPGWCDKDNDCAAGSVCEKCGPEGQCVPGCHDSSQCAEGEFCNEVQCIRCPCPGICELKTP